MNAMPHMDEICKRVVAAYRKAYGDDIEAIYLYGSYARGDFDEESDIDFAAIVKGDPAELSRKSDIVWSDTVRMDLDFDVVSSPMVISSKIFNEYKNEIGYYGSIFREGKRIA
ncbi:MAG: nucleotidyltransferase domain-containing protein [Selenomonadaceae bacterium]|nr:nucleotidyltransferase domain-containing protein [Selenomonadaceae bacterium]